jgi:phosphinothricin acetyltransferase
MGEVAIRPGRAEDLPDLTELYNHYIRETPITFDLVPYAVEERRDWLERFSETGRHRLWVSERAGRVTGYATSRTFRPKAAYDSTVETTVYLAPEAQGEGLGRRLYQALFASLADEDVHRAVGGVTLPNPASVALHESFGFEPVGIYHEVGYKFGRYWDVQWFEKEMG